MNKTIILTEEDLNMPEFLKFEDGTEVRFKILPDIKEEGDNMTFPVEILSEEHKGRIHLLRINTMFKGLWIPFLRAFFKDEDLKTGISLSQLVMKFGKCKAKTSAKGYSNLGNFEEVTENKEMAL